jgi:xanthine dehydrogenase accessory factor
MFDIAAQVIQWQRAGAPVTIARLVQTSGFSSLGPEQILAIGPDSELIGGLLHGVADDQVRAAIEDDRASRLIDLSISDQAAGAVGLSCGGSGRVLIQDWSEIEPAAWQALRDREPLCLITRVDGDGVGPTELYAAATIAAAEQKHGPGIARLFARGTTQTTLLPGAEWSAVVTALWPVPALIVVGAGLIAQALAAAADLLGWSTTVRTTAPAAVAALTGCTAADSIVVLSHDRDVDGPALQAALDGPIGYVGALGSRHTQAARREWLTAHGVAPADIDRIHGPAGLDIGAYGPAEIAVSIVAEIVAARSESSGVPLRARSGPVRG